jgi:L-amino acid N-acyltransferase YncA
MDDESNCVASLIQSLNGKTIGGQTSKAIYEITLRKKFANINEFTGTIVFSSGLHEDTEQKHCGRPLKRTIIWECNSLVCPQMVAQLYTHGDEGLHQSDKSLGRQHSCDGKQRQGPSGI